MNAVLSRNRAYIIEPQLLFVPYLSAVLTHAGYSVIAAGGTIDERELSDQQPSLVMVDIDYAERRELNVIRELRLALPHAAIFAYSDRDDELFTACCRIAGATAVISKSADERSLCDQIRRTAGAR